MKWMNHFQNLLGKSPIGSDSNIEKVIEHELEITGHFNELELDFSIEETEKQKSCWIRWNSTRILENWKI